ncbi:hypothetical protein LCM23_06780 [Cytobacillus kochii]|uniref:hypothetical protein n=1 Tax=Cytobacillus kochii TaxID=859143 RepID=UPI001CD334B4|nr:hypothetical protein [Cytobacillus kochii]MCA1025792.1 hypothetical protein [Cytobacillus kochii]
MAIVASGQLTLVDLNDAIIAGIAPANPTVGTLWIKEITDAPDELYKWDGNAWIPQSLSLASLDPDQSDKLDNASDTVDDLNINIVPALDVRLSNAEIEIDPDKIISTVTNHDTFKGVLDQKADSESLGDYATLEQLGTAEGNLRDEIADKIGQIDLSHYITQADLTQTSDSFTAMFKAGGGVNLLKNSIGFGGFESWQGVIGGRISTTTNNTLNSLGFGSAFFFKSTPTLSKYIYQLIDVVAGQPYTFSWNVNKIGSTGTGDSLHFQFKTEDNATTLLQKVYPNSSSTNGYEQDSITYTPDFTGRVSVRIYAFGDVEATITGLMVNLGSVPLQWTMATGEIYNTNVRMDINGIKVFQLENGVEKGFTQISSEEFAGFYDSDNNGTYEKVFYLKEDETVSKKFRANNEFTMGNIKIIKIDKSSNSGKGWAFVPTTE